MVERLEQILKKKNLSPAQLADEIGVQRSGIYHIMKGRNKPGMDFLLKLLNHFPEINSRWLITGQGDMNSAEGFSMAEEPGINSPVGFNSGVGDSEKKKQRSLKSTGYQKQEKTPVSGKDRNIERIVIFYDDHSFSEYYPNKKPV